jgi:peroxiredoxin
MEIALLTSRIILALVFGVAGVAKANDTSGVRRTLIEFGVPEWLAAPVSGGLPFVEILVALSLFPLATAWWGAVASLTLLAVFAIGIAVSLKRGQTPDCNCFGQLHAQPVSWSVFGRNVLLAGVAALIVLKGKDNPGPSAFKWLDDLKSGEVAGLVLGLAAVGLLTTAVVYLRRVFAHQTALLEKVDAMKRLIDEDYAEPPPVERPDAAAPLEGLPLGAPAPAFSLATVDGELVSLEALLAEGKQVLLLFVSPNCMPCKTLLPVVRIWERDYDDQLTVALISKGNVEENRKRIAKFGARHLLLQGDDAVSASYQSSWTPAAVVVSREGRIASQVTYGDDAIRALVNHTVTTGAGVVAGNGSHRHIPKITVGSSLFKIGEPAPRFSLPALDGREVGMEDLIGRDTLLLFWDPSCPFCQAISEDLKVWEDNPPKGAPSLAILASGNKDAVAAKAGEFKSLILLDPEFDIGPLYGTNSTPSAVLIDGDGRIASTLAVGTRHVLALAGVHKVELPVVSRS